jgi:2-methylcitrate dehydratase PrpD
MARQGIVDITLRNGRVLHHHTQNVRGTPQNPMTREEVEEKCYGQLRPVFRPKRAKALIDSIWNIERIGNVQELRSLLRA